MKEKNHEFSLIFDLLFIFLSFIFGNLLILNSSWVAWNGLSLAIIIFCFEGLNFFQYLFQWGMPSLILAKNSNFFLKLVKGSKIFSNKSFWKIWILLRRGLFLGIFIEAFKVGS